MIVIDAKPSRVISLGRLGENESRRVRFLVGDILYHFPAAGFTLLNQRNGDPAAYPVSSENYTLDGKYIIWTLTNSDLSKEGNGQCELVATENEKVVKTVIYQTEVLPALDGSGTVPEPWESWVNDVTDAADRAESAAALLESPGAVAETLEPGESATANYSEGTFTFGIPKGADGQDGQDGRDGRDGQDGRDGRDGRDGIDGAPGRDGVDGQDGAPGQDGFSPTLSVESITGGHQITITDVNGTQTVNVMDGTNGQDGQNGQDGFSPTASVSKSGNTATITITDKTGTTTATVSDGNPGDVIDDTAGDGDTGKTWSADKLVDQFDLKANKTDTVLLTTLSLGRKENTTVGTNSFAVGYDVEASAYQSHAEGSGTKASANQTHSEGYNTTASGIRSHVEGDSSKSTGDVSHAEGKNTTASGFYSHSEGNYTTANHKSQHTAGEYNVLDASSADASNRGNYVEIIGNGTGTSARSNARTLDWNGNERLMGDIYVGCNADSTGGTKITPLPTAPTTDETYYLQCSVSSGTATYSWVSIPTANGVSF